MSAASGASEAFAGEFPRRVNAEFAAGGDFDGSEVERVDRALGQEAFGLRVGVGAEAEEDIAGVVDIWEAHLRLLGSHSPTWAAASNSSRFPASSITSRGTQSGNG